MGVFTSAIKSRKSLAAALLTFISVSMFAQTNPTPFNLSSGSFTFTSQTATNTTYPTNMQGWQTSASNITTAETTAPAGDQALVASGTTTTTGISNLGANGFQFISSGSATRVGEIAVALNTVGRTGIQVTWTASDQQAGANYYSMGLALQYRVGTIGTFTTVASSTYTSSASAQAAAQTFTNIALPAACEGHSIVQIRWIYYQISASGASGRDPIRLDDITVSSSAASCSNLTLPVTEGFNVASSSYANPTCWNQQAVSGTGITVRQVTAPSGTGPTGFTPQQGTGMVFYNSYSYTASTRLISPPITTTGTASVDVDFQWYQSSSSSSYTTEGVTVQWSTDGTTWNDFTGNFIRQYNATTGWKLTTLTLPAGAGNIPTLYVGFKFNGTAGYDCYMDAVDIHATPACGPMPTSLTSSSITATTATISWTAATSSPANGYEYYVSTSSTAPTAGTTPTGTTGAGVVSAGLTGLSASTPYYFWVRSNCNGTDKSNWAGSATFNTPPSNDACSGATALPCGTSALAGTTVGTVSETAPQSVSSPYGVWYSFVGDGLPTTISTTAGSGYDHELLIMSGTVCGATYTTIADKDAAGAAGTETHTFTSTNGTQYFVYIAYYSTSGTSTNTGTFTMTRTCTSLTGSAVTAFGNQCINTAGGPNSFTVNGSGLSGNVTVTAPTAYTVSSSAGGTYASTLTLTPSSGNLTSVPVYVKFTPTAVTAYNSNITLSGGGATTVNIAVSGSGINTTPTATTGSYSSLTYNSVDIAGSYDNTLGCTAVSAYGIEYSTTSGFACGAGTSVASTNQVGGSFTSSLSGLNGNTQYYYRAYAVNSGGRACGTEQTFTTPNGASLSVGTLTAFGSVCINTTAGPNSFSVTSSNLSGDVTVTGPSAEYTFSTSAGGSYSTPLTLTMSGGSVPSTVYVKFTPTGVATYSGNISLSGGGASTANVAASGSGVNTAATSTSGSASALSSSSATVAGSYTLGCQSLTSYGVEYSTTNGFATGSGTQVASTNQAGGSYTSSLGSLNANTTYYFRSYVATGAGTLYGTQGSFTTLPNCASLSTPADASTNVCPFSAVLAWSAPVGGATSYKLYVGTDGSGSTYPTNFINGTNIGAVTTYTIPTALIGNTTYRWVVVPTNAGGDASTCTVFTFTTQNINAVSTTPVTQNFESTCIDWTIVNGSQTNKWYVGSATNNGGTRSMYVSSNSGTSNTYSITSSSVVQFYKDVTIPAGQTLITLSFDWRSNGESCCDRLRVFDAPTTVTPVAGTQTSTTYQLGADLTSNTTYATATYTLSAADAGTTRRIIFEWRNDASLGTDPPASVDNISITSQVPPPPVCATLTSPANNTTNLCVTGTNLTWTAPASGTTPTGYKLYYGTDNPPTNIVNGTNLGVVLTYATGTLSANTDYYWQVVPTAAAGDATGCTIYKFTTGAAFTPATSTPVTQDFEYCNDWTLVNGSQTNKWVVGSVTNNGGAKSIYVSNDGGVTNSYTITSSSVVQFYKDIAIPAGQSIINLSFDWKGTGETSSGTQYDYLRVFDAPTTVTPTAGTQTSTTYQVGTTYNLGSSYATVNLTLAAADAGTTRRIIFEWRNDGSGGSSPAASVDNISLTSQAPTPMVINTITATQQTGNIYAGVSNNNILQVNVNTTGTIGGLTLSTLKVTSANTNDADFGTIKLWSGTSAAPVTSLGTGVFSGGVVNFTGILSSLVTGNNYYWITYDVNSNATAGNVGDALINIGDITFTATSPSTTPGTQPTVTLNPAGSRPIVGKLCGTYTINNTLPTGMNGGVYNYHSFTEAVTDLNNVGINCSAVFNVKDGQTFQELVPALVSISGVNASNTVTFQRDNSTGTRPTLQGTNGVGGVDAVLQLNSTDYLTWDGINLANNTANATANTKMEYGIFLNGTSSDGCQNNVFKNSSITLNTTSPSNTNVRGARIYSTATSAAGANTNNKFYNLQISNVIWGYSFEGASAGYDNNNEVNTLSGGTSSITNFGSNSNSASYGVIFSYQTNFKVQNTSISNPVGTTADMYGIYASAGLNNTLDISNNTISGFSVFTSGRIAGIYIPTGNSASSTIAYNTIKSFTGGSDSYVSYGIYASNATFITNNTIGGTGASAITTSDWVGFHAIAYPGTTSGVSISNNRIDSITCTDIDAQLIGIYVSGTGSNVTVSNNSIQQLVNYGYNDVYGIVTASSVTSITDNTIDAIIQTGTQSGYNTAIEGDGATTSILRNRITNLQATGTATSQYVYGVYAPGANSVVSNNRIAGATNTNTSSTAWIYGISAQGATATISSDTIINFTVAGSGAACGVNTTVSSAVVNNNILNTYSNTGTGLVYGIKLDGNTSTANNNTISGFTAAAAGVYGLYASGSSVTFNGNSVSSLTVSGGSSTVVRGISVLGTGTNTVYKNVINSVVHNGTTGALAVGIQASGSNTSTNIVNNMVSNVTANNSNNGSADAVRGISLESSSTVKLYYNTVNLTGTATNAAFECAALHVTTSNALDSRNNILSNNYGGTGKKAAIYCTSSDATFNTNLNAASNNNLLYAGTPGTSNVILRVNTGGDKQAITDYTTLVTSKEAASFTLAAIPFVSSSNLHIDLTSTALCALNNKGVAVTTPLAITDDIDADTRATTPDVGADEWVLPTPVAGTATASANPSCAGSSVTVSLSGQSTGNDFTYLWQRDNGGGFVDIDATVNTTDGGVYSNFTTSTLTVSDVAGKNGYKYQCVVSRCSPAVASATSNAVTLTVSTPSTAPTSISGTIGICVGGNTTLTATGGTLGTGGAYEWGTGVTVGSNVIAGQTTATLSVTPASTTNYWVRRKDPAPCSTTTGAATATVTVNSNPTASAGSNASISNALTYTLSGSATSYSSYTWSHNGLGSLANTNTLSPTYSPSGGETGNVTITLTVNGLGGCTNAAASMVLTLTAAPVITWVGNTVDWSVATNWNPAVVPNTCNANVLIPTAPIGGNYPEVNSAYNVGNLQVQNGARITLNNKLSVCGNFTGGNSATNMPVILGNSYLEFNGSTAQTFSGKASFQTLRLNNNAGAQLAANSSFDVFVALELQLGNLNVPANATLRFRSTSTNAAAVIDDYSFLPTSQGTITGNVKAQRYYDAPSANSYNQHFMSTPVNAPALSQFGAAGTPGFVINTACSELNSNTNSPYGYVFEYDETNGTNCGLEAWKVLTSGTADNGKGYSILKNGSGVLTVTGQPNLSASYVVSGLTNSSWSNSSAQGRTMVSGWSLVGNPYLSNLDLQTALGAGIDAQVQVWNTVTGQYDPYVIGVDPVIPIAPFQAFLVHKTAAGGSATATINGGNRTRNTGVVFYQQNNPEELTVLATNTQNGSTDKTVVRFTTDATAQFDPQMDANKLSGLLANHNIYTLNSGMRMSRNNLHSIAETSTVPMSMYVGTTGTYTFSFDGIQSFDPTSYIFLEDLVTGTWTDVRANSTYTFSMNQGDNADRFVLHFTPAAIITTAAATCQTEGQLSVEQPGTASWNYVVADQTGAPVNYGVVNSINTAVVSVPAGVYTITLTDNNNYTVVKNVTVTGATPVTASFSVSSVTVETGEVVTFNNTSLNGSVVSWEFSDGTIIGGVEHSTYAFTEPGVYTVTITVESVSGCQATESKTITVTEPVSTGVGNLSDAALTIYSYGNTVVVDFGETRNVNAQIEVYNTIGQQLVSEKTLNRVYSTSLANMEAAYVIVRVSNNDKITTRKLFISNK